MKAKGASGRSKMKNIIYILVRSCCIISIVIVLGCMLCFCLLAFALYFVASGDEPQILSDSLVLTAEYLLTSPAETPEYLLRISPALGQFLSPEKEICIEINDQNISFLTYQILVNGRRISHEFIRVSSSKLLNKDAAVVEKYCFNLPLQESLSLIEFRRSPFDENAYRWVVKADS